MKSDFQRKDEKRKAILSFFSSLFFVLLGAGLIAIGVGIFVYSTQDTGTYYAKEGTFGGGSAGMRSLAGWGLLPLVFLSMFGLSCFIVGIDGIVEELKRHLKRR